MPSINGGASAITFATLPAPEPARELAECPEEAAVGPVCDHAAAPTEPDTTACVEEPENLPRWIRSAPVWVRYAAGSIIATVLSQIALTVAYGLLGATAIVASIVAFFAGTIPNYYLNKAWAWSGHKLSQRRMVVSYVLVIAVTNVAAIAMTIAADSYVRAHVRSDGPRTVLLDLAYVTSNGLMFVVKCVLFDGFLIKQRPGRRAQGLDAGAARGVRTP